MTKQEEIKLILYAVKIGQMAEDVALKQFEKLGLVIKVDGKLPTLNFENSVIGVARFEEQLGIQRDMLNAGYVAVEPLIEVKHD